MNIYEYEGYKYHYTITGTTYNVFQIELPNNHDNKLILYPYEDVNIKTIFNNNYTPIKIENYLNITSIIGIDNNTHLEIEIGNLAFLDCSNLESVDLSGCSRLQTIGKGAFSNCKRLKSVDLSGCSMLQTIGNGAFSNCERLKSVDLSGCSLQTIGDYAFNYCNSLKSINLSECSRLQTIGDYAFSNCNSLESVNLSGCSKLNIIGACAFTYCTNLESVNLSGCSILNTIDRYAFSNCKSLESIDLSECSRLQTINDNAFQNCPNLEYIDLSDCSILNIIGVCAFTYCTNLKSVNLSGCSILNTINQYAFSNCTGLEYVDLSGCNYLTTINQYAFSGCINLQIVNLSNCKILEKIDENAFFMCINLICINLIGCEKLLQNVNSIININKEKLSDEKIIKNTSSDIARFYSTLTNKNTFGKLNVREIITNFVKDSNMKSLMNTILKTIKNSYIIDYLKIFEENYEFLKANNNYQIRLFLTYNIFYININININKMKEILYHEVKTLKTNWEKIKSDIKNIKLYDIDIDNQTDNLLQKLKGIIDSIPKILNNCANANDTREFNYNLVKNINIDIVNYILHSTNQMKKSLEDLKKIASVYKQINPFKIEISIEACIMPRYEK